MIFVGKTTKKGNTNKAFTSVGVEAATHVKVKGKDEFYKIDKDLKVYAVDAVGDTINEEISYLDIKPGKRYRCKVGESGELFEIENGFYSQLVFMSKAEGSSGDYYRCDSGKYIKKTEVQIPAYKSVNVPISHMLTDTKGGKFYANIEYLVLEDGKRVYFPNDAIKREGDKWYYEQNGSKLYGEYKTEEAQYKHILVDDKIVSMKKVVLRNGEYYIEGERDDGSDDTKIGSTEVTLENPFVEGSTIKSFKNLTIAPRNQDKLKPILEKDTGRLAYTFAPNFPGPDGLMRVEVNDARTFARFIYADKHEEIYAEYSANPVIKEDVETKEYRIQKFSIQDLGDEGIRFDFFDRKQEVAEDVVVEEGKIKSYSINGDKITDIEWQEGKEHTQEGVASYKINGVKVSKIEWEFGKIKSCEIVEQLEDGKTKITFVKNLANSREFKHLAINCEFTSTIRDVEWSDGGLVAFKMGDYKFTDIEWNPDRTIHKCRIKKGNEKEEEVDFDEDKRFAQLKFMIKTAMRDQNIRPLVQTQLLEKRDGKYELKADFVQTSAMDKGVAPVKQVGSVQQARQAQKEFEDNENKYATHVIDENGVVHELTDLSNTYTGVGEFEYDNTQNNAISRILEKHKIEYKKGDITVKPTDLETAVIHDCSCLGFMFCSNPFTLIIGLPMLMVAATTSIVGPMSRQWKKNTLKQQTLEEVTEDIQQDVKKKCKEEIDELVKDYLYGVKKLKKRYSEEEYTSKLDELTSKFRVDYQKAAAHLQMLDKGNLECSFDLSENGKITKENYLAYLACLEKRDKLQYGKKDHPDLNRILLQIEHNSDLTRSQQVIQQIAKMQELGGRNSHHRAYDMQKQYAQIIVDELNKGKADDEKITVAKYLEDAKAEFNSGVVKWGSIKDKLDAYKKSDEYYVATPAKKRELLKAKREQLESELGKVKVDHVEFVTRYDEKGNNLAEKCMLDAMVHLERVVHTASTEASPKVPDFEYGCSEKMSKKEREIYLPSEDIHQSTSRVIDNNSMEVLSVDGQRAEYGVSLIKERMAEITATLDQRKAKVDNAKATNNFEAAFANRAVIRASQSQFDQECNEVEDKILKAPNGELLGDDRATMSETVRDAKVEFGKQIGMSEQTMEKTRREYSNQAYNISINEYVSNHPDEYEKYKAEAEKQYAIEVAENKKRGIKLPAKKNEDFVKRDFLNHKIKQDRMHSYATEHREEFKRFVTHTMFEEFATKTNEELKARGEKPLGKKDMMVLFKEKTTATDREMAFGKSQDVSVDYSKRPIEFRAIAVRNNIEERTYAQLYASQHPAELEQFRAKMGTEMAVSGQALTDEGVICAFYDDARATVPELHDKIKAQEGFEQAFDAAAMQIVEERKTHGKESVVSTELTEEQKKALEEEKSKKKDSGKDKGAEAVDESVDTHDAEDVEEDALAV